MNYEGDTAWVWRWWVTGVAVFVMLFGLATLKAGCSVLFFDDEARRAAGAYVPFVVWFNFIAGFFYVLAGAGILWRKRWGKWLSLGILLGTLIVYALFINHALGGGAYENRTMYAMAFRSIVWTVASITTWRTATFQLPRL